MDRDYHKELAKKYLSNLLFFGPSFYDYGIFFLAIKKCALLDSNNQNIGFIKILMFFVILEIRVKS